MKGSPMQRNFGIGSPAKQQFGKPTDTKSGEPEPDTPKPKSQSGEGKAMKTFKKIKRPTVNMPKDHPVTPPTTPRKDTLKGTTGFEFDTIPVTNVLNKVGGIVKKGAEHVKNIYVDQPIKNAKKVHKYFTEK